MDDQYATYDRRKVTWQIGLRIPNDLREFYRNKIEELQTSSSGFFVTLLTALQKNPEILQELMEICPPPKKTSRHWKNRNRDKPMPMLEDLTAESPIPHPPHKSASPYEHTGWFQYRSKILLERAKKAWRFPGDYLIEDAVAAEEKWKEATPTLERPVRPFEDARAERRRTLKAWYRERLELRRATILPEGGSARGIQLFRLERARQSLEEFDSRIQLDRRMFLKLYLDYAADRVLELPRDTQPNPTDREIAAELIEIALSGG